MSRPFFLSEINEQSLAAVSQFLKTVHLSDLYESEHVDIARRHRKGARLSVRQARWILESYGEREELPKAEPLKFVDLKHYATLDLVEAWRTDEKARLKALASLNEFDSKLNEKVSILLGVPGDAQMLKQSPKNIIEPTGKVCLTCLSFKDFSEFRRHNSSKDGYEHKCKDCKLKAATRG